MSGDYPTIETTLFDYIEVNGRISKKLLQKVVIPRLEKITLLETRIEKLERNLNTCKSDYWFMTNLLEKYSTDKEQAIKDCIERMKYRKPLFDILAEDDRLKAEGK